MTRRRLAVSAAVLAALVGEWLGHSLAYYRLAGVPGLLAGLDGGVHAYMLPLGGVLLAAAAAWAGAWRRAWLALGRRVDRSMAAVAGLRRGRLVHAAPEQAATMVPLRGGPTPLAAFTSLALGMAAVQCLLYLVQENVERSLHGGPGGGLAPLLDGFGAAAWIQAVVALVLAALLVVATRALAARAATADRWSRLARSLWRRLQRACAAPTPPHAHVAAAAQLLGSAAWRRPPPRVPTP